MRTRKEHKAAKCPRCGKRVALKQNGETYRHERPLSKEECK